MHDAACEMKSENYCEIATRTAFHIDMQLRVNRVTWLHDRRSAADIALSRSLAGSSQSRYWLQPRGVVAGLDRESAAGFQLYRGGVAEMHNGLETLLSGHTNHGYSSYMQTYRSWKRSTGYLRSHPMSCTVRMTTSFDALLPCTDTHISFTRRAPTTISRIYYTGRRVSFVRTCKSRKYGNCDAMPLEAAQRRAIHSQP